MNFITYLIILSIIQYSSASSALSHLFLSISFETLSNFCHVCLATSSVNIFLIFIISSASICISVACPVNHPPETNGW